MGYDSLFIEFIPIYAILILYENTRNPLLANGDVTDSTGTVELELRFVGYVYVKRYS